MKKVLLSVWCCAAILSSCDKAEDVPCGRVEATAPSAEVFTLQDFISRNGISAVGDNRGFFYVISRAGSDLHPTACSDVTVSYTLRLLNGTVVEASGGANFNLSNLILGWQEGIPLIGEGGAITLYLPPSLAYGGQSRPGIPPNSNLIFQIDLLDVK